MRANSLTQIANCQTTQHQITALTWQNTTNRRPTTQAITDQVLLLICGFGVQVPGAPCPNFWARPAFWPSSYFAVMSPLIVASNSTCGNGMAAASRLSIAADATGLDIKKP